MLVASNESLASKHVAGFGVVENCVSLGPLTLRSSIRLFARLSPTLLTSASKTLFIAAMLPQKNGHVTAGSRELTSQTSQLLAMFGNGHPSLIVKLACESTHESVEELMDKGTRLLEVIPVASGAGAGISGGSGSGSGGRVGSPSTFDKAPSPTTSMSSSSSASGSSSITVSAGVIVAGTSAFFLPSSPSPSQSPSSSPASATTPTGAASPIIRSIPHSLLPPLPPSPRHHSLPSSSSSSSPSFSALLLSTTTSSISVSPSASLSTPSSVSAVAGDASPQLENIGSFI